MIVIPGNKNYGLNVNAQGYLFFSENFSIKENPSSDPYLIDVPLKKIKSGNTIQLYNILFDLNHVNVTKIHF